MNIETFNVLEQAIKNENLLKKYNLDKIGVFGSFARGEKANDIDFYIDLDNYSLKDLLSLKKDLEEITEKKVDIMLKKYANPIILHRAKKDMVYVTQLK
ncbi:MAG: nucleotidyltransferase domain-containing protein [Spirochaetaceae bacterium]|nr:nucleotidyltransferase domain-containing protein [Spirochaetaceae bacterium]